MTTWQKTIGAKLIDTIIKWREVLLQSGYIVKRALNFIEGIGSNLSNL